MHSNRSTPAPALKWCLRILAACIPLLMSLDVARGEASIPGFLGTTPFTPPGDPPDGKGVTSYWMGQGWSNPAVAGCHVEVPRNKSKPRRVFGEMCQGNVLIETTPGHGAQPHAHANDVGNPMRIDCARWCSGTGAGATGSCQPVGRTGDCPTSARCVCTR